MPKIQRKISFINEKVQIDVLRWPRIKKINLILLPNTSEADSLCAFCIFQEISPSLIPQDRWQ